MLYLAVLLLVFHLWQLLTLLNGQHQLHLLPPEPQNPCRGWPKVSIIIPARDEEAEIEQALRSVLGMDYPDFEIIVVNDRSKDRTGIILSQIKAQHPRLQIVTIEQLPDQWLGKNYALHTGAAIASGELLLFTDADILFSASALKKAVGVLEKHNLDHLALGPRVYSPSPLVNLLVALFAKSFSLYIKPWLARNPNSRYFIGLGAFNLVRRSVYEQIGGHQKIPLRPDDDMKLGKLIKQSGYRQDCWSAFDDLRLAWYPSFRAFMQGLEKNVLAGIDYQAGKLFLGLSLIIATSLLPWAILLVGDSISKYIALATIGASMWGFGLFFRAASCPFYQVLFEPVILLLYVFTLARSAFLTLVRGGIHWRDTFYPLSLLRKNKV
ncbi:glycosyl transferase family 2 [Nitrosococcus halophilus Nc 4]|uniref:Glycosyl transferase family 2 n=1 Tax=Nitrosococcus halophilus (strain Nc4) TaxID=472759 RepID=D5C1M5_NITHN|nr:glycosyltransferase [Nitrosococcus halophilus]ADE14658.1 glycosyl transferase family 2 [Nitrosococcus halophilus Nc 4]